MHKMDTVMIFKLYWIYSVAYAKELGCSCDYVYFKEAKLC